MKICTLYESRLGRNDGAPFYFTYVLKEMGHDVTHLSSQELPDNWGEFDMYLWVDWGEDGLTNILPYKPISLEKYHPSVYITSDTHLGYDYRLNKAKEFDHVFCNQIRAVKEFEKDGVKAKFSPHAVLPRGYPNEPKAMKKYDIGFVGYVSFEKRAQMLDRMFKEFPNFWYGQRLFEECAEIYRKSRIIFNTAAVDDINMRCFEATATGSFLLTEYVPTLSECFEDGVHLATYKTMDEAIEKARYYLKHEDEREKVARAGMEHTLNNHTYKHRAEKILEAINV
jgi:hypothetical protein